MRRVGGLVLAALLFAGACSSSEEAGPSADEPLGELIVQQGTTREPPRLFVLELDGLELRETTPDAIAASVGRWAPDGSHVMWTEDFGDGQVDLLILGERDDDPTVVTGDGSDAVGAWSNDCVRLAYSRFDADGDRSAIWTMQLDGSDLTQVTDGPGIDTAVDWSPTADRLVFQSDRGGDAEIVAIDVDGGNEVQLTDNTVGDTWPRWSPDGERIAWASRVNERKHIFVMDADGGNVTQLTTGARGGEFPVWSPDGGWIAYEQAGTTIAIMRADGTDHRVLDVAGVPTDWGPKTGSC